MSVPSAHPVARNVASGENDRERTRSAFPSHERRRRLDEISQNRMVPSAPAVASIAPSGEKATAETSRGGASLPPAAAATRSTTDSERVSAYLERHLLRFPIDVPPHLCSGVVVREGS